MPNKMVCIKKGKWHYHSSGLPVSLPSPNYGEIVTVVGTTPTPFGSSFYLAEYTQNDPHTNRRRCFNPTRFRPIVDDEQKAADESFTKLIKQRERVS